MTQNIAKVILQKREFEVALKGFSGVRASFLPGISKNKKKRSAPEEITALWEAAL